MTTRDDDLRIRPGRIQHGNKGGKRPLTFVGEVLRAAKKAGHAGKNFRGASSSKGRSTFGRGRSAALSLSSRSPGRRVVIMTRIVRHKGKPFTASPLARHVAYLKRGPLGKMVGPASPGNAAMVAQKVITDNFDPSVCSLVVDAKRLGDGSITAVCNTGERFRIFNVPELGHDIAMNCSAAVRLFGRDGSGC